MYKNRLLSALLISALVCTLHCGESDPYASVAMQAEPGNTNGDNGDIPQLIKLRQTARLEGTYGGEIRIDGDSWKAVSSQEEISLLFNGKDLKNTLKVLKEQRDQIEQTTGKRPEIDDTTKLFMQKVLNVWISEGRDIDDEKFWEAVDYNEQFDYPVEYYER